MFNPMSLDGFRIGRPRDAVTIAILILILILIPLFP
jgi:hypothetical protein